MSSRKVEVDAYQHKQLSNMIFTHNSIYKVEVLKIYSTGTNYEQQTINLANDIDKKIRFIMEDIGLGIYVSSTGNSVSSFNSLTNSVRTEDETRDLLNRVRDGSFSLETSAIPQKKYILNHSYEITKSSTWPETKHVGLKIRLYDGIPPDDLWDPVQRQLWVGELVWSVDLRTEVRNDDVREALNYALVAGLKYFGLSTGQKKIERIKSSDQLLETLISM
jgi:hypothetical protein